MYIIVVSCTHVVSSPTHLQTIHLTLIPYPPPDYTSHPRPLPTSRLYISPSPPTHLQTIHLTLAPYPPPDYTSHSHPLPTSRLYTSPSSLPTSRLYISPLSPTHLQTIHLTLIPYLRLYMHLLQNVQLVLNPSTVLEERDKISSLKFQQNH